MTGGPVGLLWILLAALASAALETVTNNSSAVYWPGMYYHLYGTDMPCTADGCYFPVNATEDPPLAGRRRRPTSSPLLEDERDPADPCFVTGHLDLSKNWYGYLAVMNMQSVGGKLFYRFVYPENACCVKILLYLQEQMDKLRANMNCLQKQAVLDAMSPQVITLSPSIPSSGCSVNRSVIGGVRMIECSSGRMLQSARARRWYVAAVSCGSPTGLNLRYSMLIYGHVGRCPKDYSAPAVAVVARPSSWALIVNVLVIHMSLCHALL